MARMARAVNPGIPHHITQRASRRQKVFFYDEDYQLNIQLISRFEAVTAVYSTKPFTPCSAPSIGTPNAQFSQEPTCLVTTRRFAEWWLTIRRALPDIARIETGRDSLPFPTLQRSLVTNLVEFVHVFAVKYFI